MLEDFKLQTRHNKILNGIRNKWKPISVVHSEKVEEMKIKKENMFKKKDKEFKKKLLRKEEVIKNSQKQGKDYYLKKKLKEKQ